MFPIDLPPSFDAQPAAQAEPARAGENAHRAMVSRWMIPIASRSPEGKPMLESQTVELVNHGQIVNMAFAPGWVEGPPHEFRAGPGTRSFREFHPQVDPAATLCFYYRGLPCS